MVGRKKSDSDMSREDRLKAALKANMAKRKSQARARAEENPQKSETQPSGEDMSDG